MICFECSKYRYWNDTCRVDGGLATNDMECRIQTKKKRKKKTAELEKKKRHSEECLIKTTNYIISETEEK